MVYCHGVVPTPFLLAACLVLLLAVGAIERVAGWRSRRAVPIRIHVNGTRGKSTVTRLIAAALREAGVPTLGKVTGTQPRLLLPDGSERPIVRRGPANVREQSWALREASRQRVRALVIECMAVRPDLQWTAEQEMVRATIGVVTNVRLDHREVMGRSLEDIARSLSNTIPSRAVAVVGDDRFLPVFEAQARAMGTRLVVAGAGTEPAAPAEPAWLREDRVLALAVTRELGIPDAVARAGMAKAVPDPGAAAMSVVQVGARGVPCLDATAANDPESLDRIVAESPLGRVAAERRLVVYNHRADRPERLRDFARHSASVAVAAPVVVTGDRPALVLWSMLKRERGNRSLAFVRRGRLAAALKTHDDSEAPAPGSRPALTRDVDAVVLCGNARGLPPEGILHRTKGH